MIHFPLNNIRKTINDVWNQLHLTETVTIPGSADNYTISLREVPDDGSVNQKPIINGFSESTSYPPQQGNYYINYNTGYIQFNENDAGTTIDIAYYAKGSLIQAQHINYLNDQINILKEIYTISDTAPSGTVQNGYQWYDTNNGILYCYNSNRSKWISTEKQYITFGKKGLTNNQYLHYFCSGITSNRTGIRMIRDCTILSISAEFNNIGTGTFYIRKNRTNSNIYEFDVINDYGSIKTDIDIDLDENDTLHCYFRSAFNLIHDPIITIEIAWRK